MVATWLPQPQVKQHSKFRNSGGGGSGSWPRDSQAKRNLLFIPPVFYQEQNPLSDFPLCFIRKNVITCTSVPGCAATTIFLDIKGSLLNI
jgi:hypothetical protein